MHLSSIYPAKWIADRLCRFIATSGCSSRRSVQRWHGLPGGRSWSCAEGSRHRPHRCSSPGEMQPDQIQARRVALLRHLQFHGDLQPAPAAMLELFRAFERVQAYSRSTGGLLFHSSAPVRVVCLNCCSLAGETRARKASGTSPDSCQGRGGGAPANINALLQACILQLKLEGQSSLFRRSLIPNSHGLP